MRIAQGVLRGARQTLSYRSRSPRFLRFHRPGLRTKRAARQPRRARVRGGRVLSWRPRSQSACRHRHRSRGGSPALATCPAGSGATRECDETMPTDALTRHRELLDVMRRALMTRPLADSLDSRIGSDIVDLGGLAGVASVVRRRHSRAGRGVGPHSGSRLLRTPTGAHDGSH